MYISCYFIVVDPFFQKILSIEFTTVEFIMWFNNINKMILQNCTNLNQTKFNAERIRLMVNQIICLTERWKHFGGFFIYKYFLCFSDILRNQANVNLCTQNVIKMILIFLERLSELLSSYLSSPRTLKVWNPKFREKMEKCITSFR